MNPVNFSNICPLIDFSSVSEVVVTSNCSTIIRVTDSLGLITLSVLPFALAKVAYDSFLASEYEGSAFCGITALFTTAMLGLRVVNFGCAGEVFSAQALVSEQVSLGAVAAVVAAGYVLNSYGYGPVLPPGTGPGPALVNVAVPSPLATAAPRRSL